MNVALVKVLFSGNGVRNEAHCKEHAEFVREQFVAELLFGVIPKLLNHLYLLYSFSVLCLLSLCKGLVVVLHEVLQALKVESACLLVAEEHGHHLQALCITLAQCFLHFAIGYEEAEFVALVLYHAFLYKLLPNLLADLFCLLVVEGAVLPLHTHLHFGYFALLIHHLLEILNVELFAVHLAYNVSVHVGGSFQRAEEFFGNEGKEGQAQCAYKQCTFASD